MTTTNDGGPAFPRPASEFTQSGTLHDGNDAIPAQPGMTLRDYFAAHALAGMLATYRSGYGPDPDDPNFSSSFNRELAIDKNHITGELEGVNEIVGDAYLFADAMLAEREQKEERRA